MDLKNIFYEEGITNILENEPMKNHTTFKIGGPVDLMIIPNNEEELLKTLEITRRENIPTMILGNGSNLLVRDGGIRGVVIKLNDNFNKIDRVGNQLICQAGALLSEIGDRALEESLTGFEFAIGIPGTLGGAMTMNAGAYGGEMKDVVKEVRVLDKKGNIQKIGVEDLKLGYRTSLIKEEGLILLDATIELKEANKEDIKAKMDDLTYRRESKQPLEYASGGSTFKRPEGYYAGKLIDDSGLRGARYKDAQVSEKHCGFVINRGDATCKDVLTLIKTVQKVVKDKFNVELEREIMLVGED